MSEYDPTKLAKATREFLAEKKFSLVQAQIKYGIGRSVIYNMTQGIRPSVQKMIEWADAVTTDKSEAGKNKSRSKWLNDAGYNFYLTEGAGAIEPPVAEPPDIVELLREKFSDDDTDLLIGYLKGVPPNHPDREYVRSTLKHLIEKHKKQVEEE